MNVIRHRDQEQEPARVLVRRRVRRPPRPSAVYAGALPTSPYMSSSPNRTRSFPARRESRESLLEVSA